VAIVPMIRRWRRLLVMIIVVVALTIIPMILLRSLFLDHGGMAPSKDQRSHAGQ
jgi:hypothetical protein